jgi:hypothetical protein
VNDLIVFVALVGVIAAAGIAFGQRIASVVGRLAGPVDESFGAERPAADPPIKEEEPHDHA